MADAHIVVEDDANLFVLLYTEFLIVENAFHHIAATSIICPSGIAYLAVLITTGYAPSSMLSSMTIENEMMVPSLPVISPPESESTVTETQSQPLLS